MYTHQRRHGHRTTIAIAIAVTLTPRSILHMQAEQGMSRLDFAREKSRGLSVAGG